MMMDRAPFTAMSLLASAMQDRTDGTSIDWMRGMAKEVIDNQEALLYSSEWKLSAEVLVKHSAKECFW